MTRAEYALEVRELVKRYGETVAVDRLSFGVSPGTIHGLLGPNGAGKTTTLECIEGLRPPDQGTIRVLGIDPIAQQRELWNAIGVQLQESGLPKTMTPHEALAFFSRYHGRRPQHQALSRFGLEEQKDKQYGHLSMGQRRRLSLTLAVAHEPRIVFLDEPTAGLDVASRAELHGMLMELRDEGTTIVLSTHDMAEAEKLCDTITIIIKGRLAVEGTPEQITAAGDTRTKIRIASSQGTLARVNPLLPGAVAAPSENGYVTYWSETPAASVGALLTFLDEHSDELVDLRVERPSLEERFLEITALDNRRDHR